MAPPHRYSLFLVNPIGHWNIMFDPLIFSPAFLLADFLCFSSTFWDISQILSSSFPGFNNFLCCISESSFLWLASFILKHHVLISWILISSHFSEDMSLVFLMPPALSLFSLIICVCSLCSLPFILELWWKYLMVLVICSDSWLQQYKLDWRFHVYGVTFSTNGLPCQVMIWINFFFFSGSISKILVITYIFNRAVQFFHGKNFPPLACRKKTLTIELLEEGKK